MTCPFYGMHDRGGVLRPQHGNRCALVRLPFTPCRMEINGLAVQWGSCCLRAQPDPSNHSGCSARCVGCRRQYPIDCDEVADPDVDGLCPACLHRAELLALEAAGQGRLIP